MLSVIGDSGYFFLLCFCTNLLGSWEICCFEQFNWPSGSGKFDFLRGFKLVF